MSSTSPYRPGQSDGNSLAQIIGLLSEIRDALRHAPPLAAVPYEQLAGMMGATAQAKGAALSANVPDNYSKSIPTPTVGVSGPLTMDGFPMEAIPLPPARPAGSCKSVDDRPDPVANPGATNPDVTQENMATTIFVSGWTKTVRPPVSFTDALKRQQMIEYGLSGPLSDYEEDHIVPLECGGAPHDAANLWPQPRTGQWGARCKDLTENAANAALRAGAFTLQEIQDGFKTNWKDLHMRLFSNPQVVGAMMAMAIEPPEDEP